MKNQEVNVDFWAMLKTMFLYGVLTAGVWVMLRLYNTVFMLPRRLKEQEERVQTTLQTLRSRFPDLNLTEEDLKNAEQELEKELTKFDGKVDEDDAEDQETDEEKDESKKIK